MPSDRSRRTDPTRFGYTGTVAQQGRVTLDRDFNAQQGLTADRIAADALDFVGPCGTPDNGFLISLPGGQPPAPPFWSPPGGPQGSPPETPGGPGDFLIGPGTMYLGGQRVEFPAEQNGAPVTYSYFDQPDWPEPPPPPPREVRPELVLLDVLEGEVGAVEDPDELEVALGGPDTTQRLKLLRRVRRMTVETADCAAAWKAAVAQWAAEGWVFDPATMRLLPQALLKIGFTQDAGAGDPCDPVATGGYLGSDNQLIRARIAGSQVLWGYDNASFLYRVTSVSADRTTLTLASDPPDAFHVPQTGQWVEVLGTAAVLGQEPDETDPTGSSQILRVAADADGVLRQLAQPYGPLTSGDTTNYLVLGEALPPGLAGTSLPLFVRVWQAAVSLPAGGGTVTLEDPTTGISTGVTATITLPSGKKLPDGVFWQIAVRPATPQGVYPEDLLTTPQPPDGPRRWACPLAVIRWADRSVPIIDCRNSFDNLVTLTRRKPGCCTVSIGPADVSAATPLQALIDAAAAKASTVTVCLAGGNYALPSPLRLDARHNNMILEACGGEVILRADPTATASLFADGLVVLTHARGVTLRKLRIEPPQSGVPATLLKALLALLTRDKLGTGAATILRDPAVSFGVRALGAADLTLDGCLVEFSFARGDATVDLFAAAVFLQGACTGLTVRGCTFSSTIVPTYTELRVTSDNAAPPALDLYNTAVSHLIEIQSPTSTPPSLTTQFDSEVTASLDVLVSKRLAVDLAAPKGVVATAGVVAAPYSGVAAEGSADLACGLGNWTIRDTTFTELTFATVISAAMTSARMQDNNVTGGIAGLWLGLPGATAPQGTADGTNLYYPQFARFEESLLLLVLGTTMPPPVDPSQVEVVADQATTELERLQVAAPFSLIVAGNQVQTRATSANAALYFLLNVVTVGNETTNRYVSSVIVSGNRLSSTAGVDIPVALLTLSEYVSCSITGNVVLNLKPGDAGPSLWVIVAASENGAPLLAVTGNVVHGKSDIELFLRQDIPTLKNGWLAYNAVLT